MALEAMNQQQGTEQIQQQVTQEATINRPLSFYLGMGAKLLFLTAAAFFLVERYGIGHLIWLALIGWFMIWPSYTPNQKNTYK